MTIPHVSRGERPKADSQNLLIDQSNEAARLAGLTGREFAEDRSGRLQLFQLATDLVYPTIPVDPTVFTVEPTPYTEEAQLVYCYQADAADLDGSGNKIRSYDVDPDTPDADSKVYTLWHPTVFRDANGWAIGQPTFFIGDQVLARWNRQSTRWEIVAPACDVWAFELKETLTQWTGGIVDAYLRLWDISLRDYVTDCTREFEVADRRDVGYFGAVGATGSAKIKGNGASLLGVIEELRCPSDCVCGEDSGPAASCSSS